MAVGSNLLHPFDVAEAMDWLDARGASNLFPSVHHSGDSLHGHRRYIRETLVCNSLNRETNPGVVHYHEGTPANIISGCRIIEWEWLIREGYSLDEARDCVLRIKTLDDVRRTIERRGGPPFRSPRP